jgi:hypothetical protein
MAAGTPLDAVRDGIRWLLWSDTVGLERPIAGRIEAAA